MAFLQAVAPDSAGVRIPVIPTDWHIGSLHFPELGMGLVAGLLIAALIWLYLTRRKGQPIIFRHKAPDGSLDTTTTMKVVGIILAIVLVAGFCLAIVASALVFLFTGKVLQPTEPWLDALEYFLWFLAGMLGIAGSVTWAKRKTANADVIDANLRAATGVSADTPPRAGSLPRPSGPVAAVVGAVPVRPAPTEEQPPERLDDGGYT